MARVANSVTGIVVKSRDVLAEIALPGDSSRPVSAGRVIAMNAAGQYKISMNLYK